MNQIMKNKVGIVTGGGSGIGRACAIEFAKEGAKVIVAVRNLKSGEETVEMIKSIGGNADVIRCDISKEVDVEKLVAETIAKYGRLDFAVNNAAMIPETGLLADTNSENWEQVIQTNLTGTYYCIKHEVKAMQKNGGGSIVCMSSVAGFMGGRFQSSYITSKWAINGMAKCAALEYARDNIRVNTVNPGATITEMSEKAKEENPDYFKGVLDSIPTGKMATAENVAKATVWLCADFNDQITGVNLPVDGGFSSGRYTI